MDDKWQGNRRVDDGKTCDRHLCRRCGVRKASNVDWCAEHTDPSRRNVA